MTPKIDFKNANDETILRRARELVGKTLRELHGEPPATRGKGQFGTLVEWMHFGMQPNSSSEPDFTAARRELKAVGVLRKNGRWQAKERLVHNVIDYMKLADEEEFSSSGFYKKNARTLLVVYEYQADVPAADLRVVTVGLIDLEWLDQVDQAMMDRDWRSIRDKTRAGMAGHLSETDTYLLAACVKGSRSGKELRLEPGGDRVQQRAFSFKAPFVTQLIGIVLNQQQQYEEQLRREAKNRQYLISDPSTLERDEFEDIVTAKLRPFIGLSVAEIHELVGEGLNTDSKSYIADLTRRMLGVNKRRIAEFEKAGILLKTVRIAPSGRPRESMSFPAFRMKELARQSWRESDFREALTRRLMLTFFVEDGASLRFSHATLWPTPEEDLREARRVWIETVCRIRRGRAHDLPGMKDGHVAHVRPHGRDARDVDEAPDGSRHIKRSFWLNAGYIGSVYADTKPR